MYQQVLCAQVTAGRGLQPRPQVPYLEAGSNVRAHGHMLAGRRLPERTASSRTCLLLYGFPARKGAVVRA